MTCAGSKTPVRRAGVSSALPSTKTRSRPYAPARARSTVDFPVPGGPSSSTCRPVSSAATISSTSRARPTTAERNSSTAAETFAKPNRLVEVDHATDVLAVAHVLVALVDVLELVLLGDELVELEPAVLVELQQFRDGGARAARAEHGAQDLLVEQRQLEQAHVDLRLLPGRNRGGDDGSALARQRHRRLDEVTREHARREDDRIGHAPPRQLHHHHHRFFHAR